jgi:probable F420-dependent oxidoreductase
MRFGVNLYTHDRYPDARALVEIARLADDLGFETVAVGEHVVVPRSQLSLLPARWYDPLVVGATIGAVTTRVKVAFSVLVLPYHHPVRLAKAIATLDVLTAGRVILGAGAGWLEGEFDVLGVPFGERGRRLDESLAAMKELWTSDDPTFQGEWVSFADIAFEPRPLQRPHPPIWVGGWGRNAMRRAVAFGDGLYPAAGGPLSRLAGDVRAVRGMLADAGRDPAAFTFAHAINYGDKRSLTHSREASPVDREEMVFGYEPEPVLDHVEAATAAGFSHISVRFPGDDHEQMADAMRRFQQEIITPLG